MTTLFRSQIDDLLARVPRDVQQHHIANARMMTLLGNAPPWHPTGIHVEAGLTYSAFANGRIQWSAAHPGRYGGPKFHLWATVSPGGRIVNLTQNTGTFVADVAGEIELGIYMGVWKNDRGELATSHRLYQHLGGALECWVVTWRNTPATGLAALARHQPAWFITCEMVRLAGAIATPEGWSYLLDTGEAEIFSAEAEDSQRIIRLDANDDQGIITRPIDLPLGPDTVISWRWRAEMLPSEVAENTVHTHDYFSLATEFDNGRDLTWIWSSSLQPGFHFHCPIKAWTTRETHVVIRSGSAGLGQWQREQRNVYADVATAMGSPSARITKVWLIGVSTFQHGCVRASFADIVLHSAGHVLRVL